MIIDSEKERLLECAIHDNLIGQKHVMPIKLSDNKWYCYCGNFGWKVADTEKESQLNWYNYCVWLQNFECN